MAGRNSATFSPADFDTSSTDWSTGSNLATASTFSRRCRMESTTMAIRL